MTAWLSPLLAPLLAGAGDNVFDPAVIAAVVAALAAIGGGVMSFRASAQANNVSDRKVDLEEHRDALDRLKKIIEEQDRHIERVRAQADRVQEQLAREQDVSFALRNEVRALQGQVDELLRSRVRLEERLGIIDGKHQPPRRE